MHKQLAVSIAFVFLLLTLFTFTNAHSASRSATIANQVRKPRSLTPTETVPITNPQPTSMLLPAGTLSITLSVETPINTTCAYSVGEDQPYAQMQRFELSGVSKTHTSAVPLDPNTLTVNHVFVRCASAPDFLLALLYRSLPNVNPPFPRTGNLWGSDNFNDNSISDTARIDLWLGANFESGKMEQMRQINPDILILTSINAVEEWNLPDDYYLKDINGKKVEIWPNFYRLNLTKPYVAEYQARSAAKRILDSGLRFDGIFIDNVFTTMSWLNQDIYGNPFPIDADENGEPDPPWELDAKWKLGVFQELKLFRQLMPHAIVNGHAMDLYEREIDTIFNGISLGFATTDVLEGERSFASLFGLYNDWHKRARKPYATMFEASPPDLIAYGYSFDPWDDIPAPTLEFARTSYPYMRFGLMLALMNDGYFAYEYGDTWHGNDWWYDELDFNLGYPLGPAKRINQPIGEPTVNLIANGGFEQPLDGIWDLWINQEAGNLATLTHDKATAASGSASARIEVEAASGTDWHIELRQQKRNLIAGATYNLTFWAKADRDREIFVESRKGSPEWDNFGLAERVTLSTSWQPYTYTFEANTTSDDARLQFQAGVTTGTVWIDEVSLSETSPSLFRRDFDHGIVLLNGSSQPITVDVEDGYRRLAGAQAPRHEWLLDNQSSAFAITGTHIITTYDSGEWQASPPFYHNWGDNTHLLDPGSEATWRLAIPTTDTYTVTVWWPGAPAATGWNSAVSYEIIVSGKVMISKTLDQRKNGEQWQLLGEVTIAPTDNPQVRLHCDGSAPCAADALYIRSTARYNDGSTVETVTLQALDGIILQRATGHQVMLPLVSASPPR